MTKANLVQKRGTLSRESIVKYQILTHCYLRGLFISESELGCLAILAMDGESYLSDLCERVYSFGIFKSTQTVRNCISKACKFGIVLKEGKGNKKVVINPATNIKAEGNIVLDFKFAYVIPEEQQRANTASLERVEHA